jgi:hypothetical protein
MSVLVVLLLLILLLLYSSDTINTISRPSGGTWSLKLFDVGLFISLLNDMIDSDIFFAYFLYLLF